MTEAPDRNIVVRRATVEDLPTIVEFNSAMALETENRELDEGTLRLGVEAALINPGRCIYFVAQVAGVVVGQTMITFEWSDWRNRWFWWIQSVYVHPNNRGVGVFRKLYEHIRDACQAEPETAGIRLYVDTDNEGAKRTYLRMGMSAASYDMFEVDWADS